MNPVKCALCGSLRNYSVLYPANFKFSDLQKDTFSARRFPDGIHFQIVKCRKDGLVRSTPTMDSKVIAGLYKQSEMNYQDEIAHLTRTYLRALKQVLEKLPKSSRILEIGCGNGFMLEALYKMGYKNVFGVEPSGESVKQAKPFIKRNIKTDIFKKNLFPPGSFDLVLLFQTLDHIPNPNLLLGEVHRILKQGGIVVAFNHNVESLSARILRERSPIIDIEHTFLYSAETSKDLFEKNKLKTLRVFFPTNTVSLKHLLWLLGIKGIKNKLTDFTVNLKLGNLCIISCKE